MRLSIILRYGVKILGTPIKSIIDSEDRKLFAERIAEIGEKVAPSLIVGNVEEALGAAKQLGYPVLGRYSVLFRRAFHSLSAYFFFTIF